MNGHNSNGGNKRISFIITWSESNHKDVWMLYVFWVNHKKYYIVKFNTYLIMNALIMRRWLLVMFSLMAGMFSLGYAYSVQIVNITPVLFRSAAILIVTYNWFNYTALLLLRTIRMT